MLKMCDSLLDMFGWPDDTGSEIRMRKASVMAALGQKEESAEFCKEWLQKETENIMAATAGVYAFIKVKAFEETEKLVEHFILNKSKCTDENDIMFTAASTLYQVAGKKKSGRYIRKN